MKFSLRNGTQYAAQRKQFGKAICEFGLVREKLARAAAQIYAVESMTYRASGAIDDAIGDNTGAREVMAGIEEYAIEASILKVAGSEWMAQVIDEMLQIHGGNGFVTDYPIERAYRDNRVNRIFEGTNEINRLLIPGMIFKRAMKGEMPLMEAVMGLDEELSDPRHFPAPVGRLAEERRGAEMAKRQFLFAAKWAATLGPSLEERQEVLAALADCAIEVYAMDSILGRTLESDERGTPRRGSAPFHGVPDDVRDGLCRFFCMESRERAFDRARTALCAVVSPEDVEAQLEQLSRLHKYTPVNSAEAREQIVPAVLESPGYPLAY
jgi:alkylation response protein AidB-like acyl-CoA dehydrogenase